MCLSVLAEERGGAAAQQPEEAPAGAKAPKPKSRPGGRNGRAARQTFRDMQQRTMDERFAR